RCGTSRAEHEREQPSSLPPHGASWKAYREERGAHVRRRPRRGRSSADWMPSGTHNSVGTHRVAVPIHDDGKFDVASGKKNHLFETTCSSARRTSRAWPET